MYKVGTISKVTKFNKIMKEIIKRNIDACNYLKTIDSHKWTLVYDGDYMYGCRTTKLFESLNSVFKKCCALPLKALVSLHRINLFITLVNIGKKLLTLDIHSLQVFGENILKIKLNHAVILLYNIIQKLVYLVSSLPLEEI